ncbi:MAG: 50S ribosomal protein L25/general stress protein Ctc [Micavibrio sp.]
MAKNYALLAEKRDRAGKGVARALRREKRIPAVVYGDGKEPVLVSLLEKDISKEYQRGFMFTHLCDLEVGGAKQLCIARDIQLHPVTDRIEHADFLRVTPKTKIVVDIPVHFMNHEASPGLKAGGVLNIVAHELPVLCSATDIPESIDVDLSGAEIGDALYLGKSKLRSSAVPVDNDPEYVLATIQAPKAAIADEEADAAVAAASAAASAVEAGAAAAPVAGAAAAPKKDEKK